MKKRIIRLSGVGLIVALMTTMLMAIPASAAEPLKWYEEDIPSTSHKVLQPSLNILDMSVNPDGETIYAVGWVRGNEPATATVGEQFAYTDNDSDGDPEVFDIKYTNQDGTTGRMGTLSITDNASADDEFSVTLATGDTGIKDLDATAGIAPDDVDANLASGNFTITSDTTGVVLGYYVIGDQYYDGSAIDDTTKRIYKSTNGGVGWTDISDATGLDITETQFVACAPDDPDIVIVADGTSGSASVYISDDGGIEFGDVDLPIGTATYEYVDEIYDIDVSAAVGGVHYAAVCGTDGASGGGVWYYKLGIGGSWTPSQQLDGFNTTEETDYNTTNEAWAIAFSPNFASDQVLTAVTDNGTDVFFEMLAVSTTAADSVWNDAAGFDHYPVTIQDQDGASLAAVTGASIALAPTYLGGDEVERVAMVGILSGTDTEAGVYRLMDYVDKQIMAEEQQVYSVAYDGTTAVAGQDNCIVWRCSDPLTTIPTFYPTTSTKAPGGTENPILAWLGTSVVAATAGNESAFSISEDDGKSFNDISLIDTSIASIDDVAVATDGTQVYFTSNDGLDLSVWRMASDWKRVLSITGDTGYIIRVAPGDSDIIYVAEKAGKSIYFGKEGGDSKWYSRRSAHNIQDMAVESDDVAYIAIYGQDSVIKTTNSGFTWGAAEDTELAGGDIYTITTLGEDKLIVGSDEGYVSYSTDGNDSWDKIKQQISSTATTVQVTAGGLEDGDYIYAAASGAAPSKVYRWMIGQADSDPWKSLVDFSTYDPLGIAWQGGWLYVLESDGAVSELKRDSVPFAGEPAPPMWSTSATGPGFAATPSALRVSTTETSTKIWAGSSTKLYSYDDVLSQTAPTLIGPADGTKVKINPIHGYAYDVSFSWNRIPYTDYYDLWIALDPGFMEKPLGTSGFVPGLPTSSFNIGPSGTTAQLNYMAGTKYYWKVRVSDTGDMVHSKWSETRSFTVEAGTAVAPSIGSPENGATITTLNPAFSWSPVAGATKYEFQLAVSTNFAAALHTEQLAETGIRPTVKLDEGMTYFWRVRAIEPMAGDWSTIANFTVAEPEEAAPPPVVVETTPAPQINIPAAPPQQVIELPEAPAPPAQIAPGYIWAVIIIGAVLVIAVIVLIVRTRRTV